ncbi:NmrA family NAD(P)-binding protein [Geodermatophilus sp. DSM 44513]|uniref:NmrA family NAD(P)-binding protein n=1 Tax=Geodermatophilus sp. DSM 44513 TaxID=1528104 RepID=UPI001411CE7D|nr:NmrA family NAD(P)-binding protein [Geodermatophilus sp. DSM 44513]WNV75901.1 NmrA family NAD(P)-binding protein [Geodermatophilus sp. DSM 44513]
MTVLVTGSTGTIGRRVAESLDAAGAEVRRAVRPGHRYLPEGAVAFDLTDPGTWPAAFAGVDTLFLVRPPDMGDVRRGLLPAVAAARDAGVRSVVFLSVQGVERLRVVPHATVERWLRGSGLGWTFVRPSFFTQNLVTVHTPDIRDRDSIVLPAGSGRTAFVDARDVAAVAAAALLDPVAHRGRAWTVTGPEALTYAEVADVLGDVLGRPITYRDPGVVGWLRHARRTLGLPARMALLTAGIYTTARLGLAAGVTDDVRSVTGRAPATVRETAVREQAAWRREPDPSRGGTP